MNFYIQGVNKHDLMPLESIFDKREVKQTGRIVKSKQIMAELNSYDESVFNNKPNYLSNYTDVDKLPVAEPCIQAQHIMTKSVITISSSGTINQILKIFEESELRHLPVISTNSKVVGVVSDRDVFNYLAGLKQRSNKNMSTQNINDSIVFIMKSPVLTASLQTDIRYIARLFIERRIGSMPIVEDGHIKGIITRSDILQAVITHYELELWI